LSDLFGAGIAGEPAPPYESTVRWVPAFLVDETSPEARETPDHWLIGGSGSWLVGDENDGELERRPIAIGETMVFSGLQEFGNIEVVVRRDGEYEILQGAPHPRAELFWEAGDPDTISSSVEVFASSCARGRVLRDGEEEVFILETYRWDDTTFRLVAGIEGLTFVPVDAKETEG
jgi:hypothetical protein